MSTRYDDSYATASSWLCSVVAGVMVVGEAGRVLWAVVFVGCGGGTMGGRIYRSPRWIRAEGVRA